MTPKPTDEQKERTLEEKAAIAKFEAESPFRNTSDFLHTEYMMRQIEKLDAEPRRWKFYEGDIIEDEFVFVEASAYDAVKASLEAVRLERDKLQRKLEGQWKRNGKLDLANRAGLVREVKLLAVLRRIADPWDPELNSFKLAREALAEHEKGGTK